MVVRLTGYIDVPPERLDEVRAALPEHTRLTLAEQGCLSFEVIECATPVGRFDVRESFTTPQAFKAHQLRGSKSAWAVVTKDIPRHYSIEGLEE